jgi:hypothetical protein
MRLFFTAADEAALRGEVGDQAAARWRESVESFRRVLEEREMDHAAELARVVDPSGPFVAHLTAEVAFWRAQFQHERQRAEVAIDRCRSEHLASGPVALPPREHPTGTPDDVAAIFQSPEMAMMGLSDGVE